jgi:hypothetical protein
MTSFARVNPLRPVLLAVVITLFMQGGSPLDAQITRQFESRQNQIVIGTEAHWSEWERPRGTVQITPTGELIPRRWNRNVDATDDIVDFLRFEIEASVADPTTFKAPERLKGRDAASISMADAVFDAGSNVDAVVNILDGDEATFWEPTPLPGDVDAAVIPALWWFTIDLGRIVFIRKIILKFAPDEHLGDPFLLYDVLVSDGRKPISAPSASSPPDFFPALISLVPNTSERIVEIDLQGITGRAEPLREGGVREHLTEAGDEGQEAESAEKMATLVGRFVQVVIQGSRLDRGHEITDDEYELLPSSDRGAIDYFKKLPDGSELPVNEEVYSERLEELDRGSVRHYRRERPRLAELEVVAEGDDIAHGIFRRGGAISSPDSRTGAILLDSNVESAHLLLMSSNPVVSFDRTQSVIFDLGSFFWLAAHRMTYSFPSDGFTFGDYILEVSDGSLEPDGSLQWSIAVDREQSATLGGLIGRITEGNDFDPVAAQFVKLQWNVEARPERLTANPSEIQFFGAGFQPNVTVTSQRIPLEGAKNLISIEWDAMTPPGTKVQLQTRTGNSFFADTLYYHGDNMRLYEGGADEYYDRKNRRDKGDKIRIWVDGPDWEKSFSAPYDESAGSPITSPSPREFVRIQATLTSERPEVHATLQEIRLNFADPVAGSLVAEITPSRVDSLAVPSLFSVYVSPAAVLAGGFDQLLLAAPSDMELSYRGLYAGKPADFSSDDADLSELAIPDVQVVSDNSDSLIVNFPAVTPGAGELLRLDIEASLFSISAPLGVSLRLGEGFWQRAGAGDATESATDNTLTLVAKLERRGIIRHLAVEPPVFTPNGDTINDEVLFRFDVVVLRDSNPVEVHIYDLSSRRIKVISQQRQASTGAYALTWDGTDESGNLVPPGVYAALIRVDANTDGARLSRGDLLRTVAVAY